jgi:hypothetical protein
MLVEDISSDSRAAHPNLISMEGLRAFASVPIRAKDRVLGVLNIASHEAHSHHKSTSHKGHLVNNILVQPYPHIHILRKYGTDR